LLDTIAESIAESGQDEVSLSALSTADVSYISPLIKKLSRETARERVSLGVASLRAYGLGEDLLSEIRKVRATGLTFAPEAGTQRLRDVINKNVTEEQILATAERVFAQGWHRTKLYFIMGLPTETDDDLLGIVEVGRKVLDIGRKFSRKRPEVTVSVSVHVPKPHTPFQWCAMDSLPEIKRKQALLRAEIRKVRGLELKLHDPTASVLECVLARGDRRLADVIESAFESGASFDSWDEYFHPEVWDAAFQKHGVAREVYLGTLPVHGRLPWDHIDVGLDPEFLPREYRLAMKGRLSPPCGKPFGMHLHHTNVEDASADARKLVCYACGIECDLQQMRDQRLQFLGQLGASSTGAEAKPPEVSAEAQVRPEQLRPARNFGSSQRLRFRFAKLESAVFLGHGDLIRELPRMLRRAGLRLKYSEGFHPKPELSFAPALSLGIPSLDEYFDAEVIDPPAIDEVLPRLAQQQTTGIWFRGAVRLGVADPGLSKLVHSAHYAVLVPAEVVEALGGELRLTDHIGEFMAKESALIARRKGKSVSQVDARRFVQQFRVAKDETIAMLGLFEQSTPRTVCDLVISVGQNGSVKPREVFDAMLPSFSERIGAIRVALLDERGESLFKQHSLQWSEATQWNKSTS
jgi:radical SAM-linked protein